MIREYRQKDLSSCASIFKLAFSKETWGSDWSQERAKQYLQDMAEHKKFVGFVYEEEGEILGALFGCEKVCWNGEEMHIDEMFVRPDRQGKGIGKQLLCAAKDYCKEQGLAGLVLYTNQYAPAKTFYERNGFNLSEGTICMYWV